MSYICQKLDEQLIKLLKEGGVGLLPSDTIYGLSCLALDSAAVEKIHKIKDRDDHKPFIVLISDLKMLDLLSIDVAEVEEVNKYWPGPLTIISNAPSAPAWLRLGLGTLAIRMPANKDLLSLINLLGPIVSTSANISGQPPVKTAKQAIDIFGDRLDFYVDAGVISGVASTIVKNEAGQLKVIRPGAAKI